MTHDPVFDSTENRALLVVCARMTIRTAAMLGIVWGCINLGIGFAAVQANLWSACIIVLGLLMVLPGIAALMNPSVNALLGEAFAGILLFGWNAGIAVLNVRAGHIQSIHAHGLILPLIAALLFLRQYVRLRHLKQVIVTMDRNVIDEASALCKQLFKSKIRQSPDVVEASSKRYRVRFMSDSVFCVQRNLAHAFRMNVVNFHHCITNPNRKRIRVVVRHPFGKLTYAFNKKNSDKIKAWLGAAAPRTS
jgi:hypothetical protein